ncbi:MAG: hypothetical protein WCY89_02315 [Flavobacteriaceae bacterium]
MKLTTAELQFIDNYLKNSDVKYFDIRMELADHIASAVEEKMQKENMDFYEAFKKYMVINKKTLLNQNKYSLSKSFTIIARGYYHWATLLFIVLSLAITQLSLIYFGELKTLLFLITISYFVFLLILYILIEKKGLNYSAIAHLGISMVVVYQVIQFFSNLLGKRLKEDTLSGFAVVFLIILMTTFMVFIRLYVSQYQYYKKKYL